MPFDPDKHRRRSIRLRGFDYASPGGYFVTICAWRKVCLFGDIVDHAVRLNEFGLAVVQAWRDLPNHYPHITLDEFVVMPDHVHGIVFLLDSSFR